jgi:hypothetical protein
MMCMPTIPQNIGLFYLTLVFHPFFSGPEKLPDKDKFSLNLGSVFSCSIGSQSLFFPERDGETYQVFFSHRK